MPNCSLSLFLLLFGLNLNLIYGQQLRLTVKGDNEVQTKIIDSIGYINIHTNLVSIEMEIDSIISNSIRLGFFNSELIKFENTNDSIYQARLDLGQKVKSIQINYAHLEESELISNYSYKSNDSSFAIKPKNLEQFLAELTKWLASNSDPFTQLSLVNIEQNGVYLNADLKIEKTQKRKIDNIIVKGYENFPKSFIKNYVRLKKGRRFNLSQLERRSASINNLQFANQTRDPEVLFTKDSTIIYLYIEKKQANNFDGFLGFGTNEDNGKIKFNGYLNLNLVNNLNYGESLSIYYKSDENDQRTFNAHIEAPYLFGTPIGASASLNIFKRDSTFLTSAQNASVQYQFGSSNKLSIGIDIKNSENLLDEESTRIQDFDATFLKIQYLRVEQAVNDNLFPLRYRLFSSFATGERSSDFGDVRQNMVEWDVLGNFRLNNKNSIYGRLSGGYLNSDNYLENEQFRFGGIRSIRGFEENSIIADFFTVLNTEYRYKLSPSFYVHTILDYSYYENQLNSIRQDLFGFGLGLGVITQAGLLKFNYAGQKIENMNIRLSDFKIHISLTASF